MCDVVLLVENTEISCHKLVLITHSPYFLAMFSGGLLESKYIYGKKKSYFLYIFPF